MTELTAEEARKLARAKLSDVAQGVDPVEDKRTARAAPTVGEICDWYLEKAESGELLGRRRRPIAKNAEAQCVRFPTTKSGAQLRAIGRPALELLQAQPTSADAGAYVFPAEVGGGHFVGIVRVLQRLCMTAKLDDVTPHVLRHTFASVAGDMGFSELTSGIPICPAGSPMSVYVTKESPWFSRKAGLADAQLLLKALKRLADMLFGYSGAQLKAAETASELIEVENDGDEKAKPNPDDVTRILGRSSQSNPGRVRLYWRRGTLGARIPSHR